MNNEFDIAIVGMSCRFPGARNVDEFWRNLAEGVESITRLSDEEILESGVPRVYLSNPNYVKAAPVLEEPGDFDAAFFGFSPMEARTMDPQHRILLELAHEALEDAGYDPDRYQGRVGVFTGAAMNTYFMNSGLNRRFAEDYIPDAHRQRQGFSQHPDLLQTESEGAQHHRSDRLLHLAGRRPSGPAEPVERRDRHGAGRSHLGAGSASRRLLFRRRRSRLPTAMSEPSMPGPTAPCSAAAAESWC